MQRIMKRFYISIVTIFTFALLLTSCDLFKKDKDFDKNLLPGKWKENTVYEKYYSNGEGATWDTSDDVTEDEAQPFTWTLVKEELTQIHIMEMGGKIPKRYTVTVLTPTKLSYHDDYDKSHTFSKVD